MVENFYYPLTKSINYQDIMSVDGFISSEDLIKIEEQLKTEQPSAAIVGEDIKNDEEYEKRRISSLEIRKSNVSFLHDASWDWLYEKLSSAVKYANVNNYSKVLYGISPLQYTEYDSVYKGFYKPHVDNERDINTGLYRSLSFTLQLTDGDTYTGGDVKIYSNNMCYVASRKMGVLTFFDSNILHEVTPVTSGFRKSLVGWVLGPRV